ncbi:hypothetical protein CLAIMM_06228 isoform 2 [Cladophialophora immunda]|nr:hypothetical protein CLAIMM_06228 isoform 1 [Cladophialophora immunda]OQV00776.1 hypothetical protein CLAIMM_06228 isoform 2 [Cladophialophora immunda]
MQGALHGSACRPALPHFISPSFLRAKGFMPQSNGSPLLDLNEKARFGEGEKPNCEQAEGRLIVIEHVLAWKHSTNAKAQGRQMQPKTLDTPPNPPTSATNS